MAEETKQKSKAAQEAAGRGAKKSAEKPAGKPAAKGRYLKYLALVIVLVAIIAALAFGTGMLSGVSFSSFKQNFDSAKRVAVVVYYYNSSIYNTETICSTDLVEVLAAKRNPSTIDFFTIDNGTCTYIPDGIGHPANVLTNSSAMCLNTANSEPSISMSYSPSNYSRITPYHLGIYGNAEYFRSCPIAVDIS